MASKPHMDRGWLVRAWRHAAMVGRTNPLIVRKARQSPSGYMSGGPRSGAKNGRSEKS
jgi:hypothetical protein